MAKGSQLAQLKSALNSAGIRGQPPPSKKRKRTARAEDTEREKKAKAARLEEIHRKLNPFDEKVTKLKHDVLGRKLKGIAGKPAKSKQAGIEQRKKTLLQEHATKHHAGGIVDRRIGENDPTMTPEERMLERFTRERQRTARDAGLFNLDDETELTHYGQSLSNLDDFDGAGLALDDEEEEEDRGQLDASVVKRAHFGGFSDDEEGDEPDRQKSKAEVMAEVIAKSKEHKARRQLEAQENADLRMELDQEFDALRSLLTAASATAQEAGQILEKKDADYDAAVRSLAFDQKAKAKDRIKTEEELAAERAEELEKAEKRRLRRMQGLEEESGDEEGGFKARRRGGQGDDLDDDFVDEEGVPGLGAGLGDEVEFDAGDEDSSQENDDEEDSDQDGEEEEDADADDDEDDEDPEASDGSEPEARIAAQRMASKGKSKSKSSELPYTFPCPSTHEEFLDIIENIQDEDVPTVVQRIRTLYHPSLAEDNKLKLQDLARVLVDHILHIAQPPASRFPLISSLLPHLLALTKSYPISVAEHLVSKLVLMERNFKRSLSLAASTSSFPARVFPGLPELALLRVLGVLFPTSDLNHAAVNPARVLMGAYLALGLPHLRTLRDLASGLFVCSLWASWEARSQRFVPEAVAFCANAIARVAPTKWKDGKELPGAFPIPAWNVTRGLRVKKGDSIIVEVAKPNMVQILASEDVNQAKTKVDLLNVAVTTLWRFADMYKDLDGFIELFEPILELLDGVQARKLPHALQTQLASTRDALARLLKFARQSRQPLLLQAHKPIPIPTYLPKFSMSTSGSSFALTHNDPDKERVEAQKLRRQFKQEKKGAMRELRKDARFLAEVREKEQRQKDEAYEKQMRRVMGSLEGERAEEKAEIRAKEKDKQRKRAGRK
ncbi:Nop14-like protein [Punctularia strigosozonata HHB-11173 SS5]|uniref:Nop14-like protein n=1 Tax=Punctularia strigosozonata (strain HHB-11173) TaxID=741275 RepID=UPI0004417066|nr:Nop14-like protein [Punctularia strigosozonata HHB-11173 SS5]EIN11075.1 Nop14-like protein [Punctularia strigosozonata HHB-11173 SS5]